MSKTSRSRLRPVAHTGVARISGKTEIGQDLKEEKVMRKKHLSILCGIVCVSCLLLAGVRPALAADERTCPDTILDTNTITGTYLGWHEQESMTFISIQIPGSMEIFNMAASQENAERFFGRQTGQKVSATYIVKQFLDFSGECLRYEALKEGHVLGADGKSASTVPQPGEYRLREDGISGKMTLARATVTGKYPVSIATWNEQGNTCEFEGFCSIKDGMLICPTEGMSAQGEESHTAIRMLTHGLEVVHENRELCGLGVTMKGLYLPE